MLTALWKKKISEEKVANIFVNTIFNMVENSFADVAEVINSDPEFEQRPKISSNDYSKFLLIILSGNLELLTNHFLEGKDDRIRALIYPKLAQIFEISEEKVKELIKENQSYMKRVNYPSKNVHYAMSKAIFFKYKLNDFQKEYFKNLDTPNPIFLKHLDDLVEQFIINWEDFQEKYKVTD